MRTLLLTSVALVALSTAAKADVQIKMQAGSQCWSYQGLDTRFTGDFGSGQALTMAVVEQSQNEKGGMEATASDITRVWINGPGYFKDGYGEENKQRVIVTKKPGNYMFNLYEHGTGTQYPVFVKICATKKGQYSGK